MPKQVAATSAAVAVAAAAAAAPARGARFYAQHPRALIREVLNGITVACMQVPESIAFSYIGFIDPIAGLYSTFFIGLFVAALGGKPGMIGGLAGALMVVSGPQLMGDAGLLGALPAADRWQHYLLTMVLVGVLQLAIGGAGLTAALRLIPRPTHLGFLNGLAAIILRTQVREFNVCSSPGYFVSCPGHDLAPMSLRAGASWAFLGLVAAAVGITLLFPRVPRIGKALPSSLVAIVVCTAVEHGIFRPLAGVVTRTVADTAPIAGTLPPAGLPHPPPDGSGWRWSPVLQVAAMLTLIGTAESLLSLRALDAASAGAPHVLERKLRQECLAEGAGNLVGALCGSVGGGIMIGTSTVNVLGGSTGRLSGTVAALAVLAVVLVAAPAVALIPAAALVGLMLVVVLRTADWGSLRALPRMPRVDAFQLLLVSVLCVVVDIAVAVAAGVLLAALTHVWRESRSLTVVEVPPQPVRAAHAQAATDGAAAVDKISSGEPAAPPARPDGVRVLHVHGRLNFATAWAFEAALAAGLSTAPRDVIVEFDRGPAAGPVLGDYSALHAMCAAVKAHVDAGVSLRLRGVDAASIGMLTRAAAVTRKGRGIVHLALAHLETSALDPPAGLPAAPPAVSAATCADGVATAASVPVLPSPIDVAFDAERPHRVSRDDSEDAADGARCSIDGGSSGEATRCLDADEAADVEETTTANDAVAAATAAVAVSQVHQRNI